MWRKHLHNKTPEITCTDYLLLTPSAPASTGALIRLLCVYAIREALFQYGGRGSWSYYCADAGTPTPSVSLRRSLVRSASSAPRRLNSDTRPRSSHQMRMPSGGRCPAQWQSHLFSFLFSFSFFLSKPWWDRFTSFFFYFFFYRCWQSVYLQLTAVSVALIGNRLPVSSNSARGSCFFFLFFVFF